MRRSGEPPKQYADARQKHDPEEDGYPQTEEGRPQLTAQTPLMW
jgi:hypothetical protein